MKDDDTGQHIAQPCCSKISQWASINKLI